MRYKGKACEIVGEKEVLGQRMARIRLMEDGSFHEVPPVVSWKNQVRSFPCLTYVLFPLPQKSKTKLPVKFFGPLGEQFDSLATPNSGAGKGDAVQSKSLYAGR